MISKGFMKPSDLCIVDMEGNQLAGHRKRSSEILLHLTIMKERPDINSVVHCHPPHATAFAVAREPIPQCVLPEVEVFLGDIPITKYETPGGQKFADTVKPYVKQSNVVILANHGTVSFGDTVEIASRVVEFRRSSFDIEHKITVAGELAVGPERALEGALRAGDVDRPLGAVDREVATEAPRLLREAVHPRHAFAVGAERHRTDQTLVLQGQADIVFKAQGAGAASVGTRINRLNYFNGAVRLARFTPRALMPNEFLSPPQP